MARPAVVFDGVWKKFRRGERHDSLRDLIPAAAARLLGRSRRPAAELNAAEFWAVHDVSFEVSAGEALGIIGPNGAGKSTILKLLSRILRPTRGSCEVRGRAGALIEVAAGFHPDLTGRENVFLQGAIMGMKRADTQRKFDEIVEFAGVSEFIDTQVKRYSSGMNARLGFSIAAHLNPHVLIIDEVLSVGDAAFQERCLNRMFEFRERGVTIVFVSHDLQAVSTLCHRALYLQHEVRALGPTPEVIGAYLRDSTVRAAPPPDAPLLMTGSQLLDASGAEASTITPGTDLTVRVECDIRERVSDLTLGLILYRSTDHLIVYEGNVVAAEIDFDSTRLGRHTIDFHFRANLIRGHYHVECYALHTPTHSYLARLAPAAMFTVDATYTCRGVADIALRASADAAIVRGEAGHAVRERTA